MSSFIVRSPGHAARIFVGAAVGFLSIWTLTGTSVAEVPSAAPTAPPAASAAKGLSPEAVTPQRSGTPAYQELNATPTPSKEFTEDDAAEAVKAIIAERSKDGVFSVRDSWTGTDLALVFDEVRLVRGLQGHGWFPNVVFHDKHDPEKQYAIDFWLVPEGDHLKLMDMRVQKEPKPYGQSWVMITRLPLAWWWLPTMQRSSRSDVAVNWQVMSSIYTFVLNQQKDGVYWVRDEKTGTDLSLELVEVLQPVLRLKSDGRYFVCTAFRETGKGAIYDVDFWVDQKSGSVSVGAVEPRKSSIQENATCEVPVSVLTDLYFDVLK